MANTIRDNAQADWLEKFVGAVLAIDIEIGSPMVRRIYHRTFDHVGRNAHFISVFGRVLLGEDQVKEPEQTLMQRIEENNKAFSRKLEGARAIMMDAGITSHAKFSNPIKVVAHVISPVQKKYLALLQNADELLVYLNTLWLHGEIDDSERSKREMEIKNLLRAVSSVSRKMRIYMQVKVNEHVEQEKAREAQGSAKPAASAVADKKEGEDAVADTAASEVAPTVKPKRAPKKAATTSEEPAPQEQTAIAASA